MIKISVATSKEALNEEWQTFTHLHYGQGTQWVEKNFRFKATENGKIVGTVEGGYESSIVYIATLMVAEDARSKGIGTKLIQAAEQFGKKLGAHRTWLSTGEDWSNRPFYEKLGFTVVAHLPDFYFHRNFVVYTRLIK